MTNEIVKEPRFDSSLDNLACHIDPYNILICPILEDTKDSQYVAPDAGATTSIDETQSSVQSGPKVLGVVQFMNKRDRARITDKDTVTYQ